MGKVAYSIKAAAKAASVDKGVVVIAIQDGDLTARRVGGTAIVLRCDLKRWLESQPAYLREIGRIPESITR